MPSEASQQVRATLVNDRESVHVPLEVQRREWEGYAATLPPPAGVTVEAVDAGGVPAFWVRREGATDERVILFLHGGGYTAGSFVTHRDLTARLARVAEAAVLVAEYRLAPEHPYPAALDDAVRAYRWLREKVAPARIVFGGDSAGGGLAVATLVALRDAGDPLPAGAFLLSPTADCSLSGESMTTRATLDPTCSREGLEQAFDAYLKGHDARDPLVSPVFADLRGLPPLFIIVGDHEVLLSDSTRLADGARAAGVEVRLDVWPEMWHVFPAFDIPEAEQALNDVGAWVRERVKA